MAKTSGERPTEPHRRHHKKWSNEGPLGETEKPQVLEAIDREIAFYRQRAGQVFFLSLAVEVLILAGREKIVVPKGWPWIQPLAYGLLFIAVAVFGILLGREYQNRIHLLKEARKNLADFDPPAGGLTLSEIEMLYAVLVFLSSSGLVLVWLNALTDEKTRLWAVDKLPWHFWPFFTFFVILGACAMVWVARKTIRWVRESQSEGPK